MCFKGFSVTMFQLAGPSPNPCRKLVPPSSWGLDTGWLRAGRLGAGRPGAMRLQTFEKDHWHIKTWGARSYS